MKKLLLFLTFALIISSCSNDKKEDKNPKDSPNQEEKQEEESSSISELISDENKSHKTMIIFDASGSMWGLINGTKKLDIAKNALKDTVKNLNDSKIGLMAYGHRRNGDCGDIEILTNPQKNNSENISKILDKISPKGRTPIGGAISEAAKFLNSKEIASNVILISDGDESCGVNLCEFAKELKSESKNFKVSVIAFNIENSETTGLRCLANETGGEFIFTKDGNELNEALSKTTGSKKKTFTPNSQQDVDSNAIVKLKLLGKTTIENEMTISWTAPNDSKDIFAIVPQNSFDFEDNLFVLDDLASRGGISKIGIPTKKGSYDIVYWHDKKRVLARENFEIKKTIADISAEDIVDIGQTFSVTWIGPNNKNDVIAIVPSDSTAYEDNLDIIPYLDKKTGIANITAPFEANDYDIIYLLNQKHVLSRRPLKVNDVVIKFAKIEEKIKTSDMINLSWTGPNREKDIVALMPYRGKDLSKAISTINAKNGSGMLMAPPKYGYYELTYWLNGKKKVHTQSIYIYNK